MRRAVLAASILALVGLLPSPARAYEPDTHLEIGRRAAAPGVSSLDVVLKWDLGFRDGAGETFGNRSVIGLVGHGARLEDVPFTRALNHFHNPLEPWDNAGLRTPLGGGQASVRWQQSPTQNSAVLGGGNWSWQDARRRFLRALTGETKRARDRDFADLFLNLGRLSHLVQDATVPAHTRNDPHPYRDGYESWVDMTLRGGRRGADLARRARFFELLHQEPRRPPTATFSPTGDVQAPVPVARLIDDDRFLGLDLVLGDPSLGVAEYTNGNFVSDDTIFRTFALPRPESLDPAFPEREARGERMYYPKVRDGEAVRHFVADGVWVERLRFRGSPLRNDVLTDRVYEDYAAHLLPRAVGHSAALLDYFFRGRLDVELSADTPDAPVVALAATNRSPDPLVGGALALYADFPDGARRPLAPLLPPDVANVGPGETLPDLRFQLTGDAERFVAVWQGTLGHETADPGRGFPGGVIGKALGGVRVEEIFADGDRWKIRTPRGVFALPLAVTEWEQVKWGDAPNLLVSRTRFAPDALNRVAAWELSRAEGTADPFTDAAGVVRLTPRNEATLPWGMSVGTLRFRQTRPFQGQQILRVEREQTQVWDESARVYVQRGFVHTLVEPLVLTAPETVDYAFDIPLVLDRAHGILFGTWPFANYFWDIFDVGVDRTGRLLAVVVVSLTEPDVPPRTFPLYNLDLRGSWYVHGQSVVPAQFPRGLDTLLWALVDLGAGTVLASTAEPIVTLTGRYATPADAVPSFFLPDGRSGYLGRQTLYYIGGDRDREVVGPGAWELLAFVRNTQPTQITEIAADDGLEALTLAGHMRAELDDTLARAGAPLDFRVARTPFVTDFVYGCEQYSPRTNCSAVRLKRVTGEIVGWPVVIADAVRARSAERGERLVLIAGGSVVAWDPGAAHAEVRAAPGGDFTYLGAAGGGSALASFGTFEPEALARLFVPLEGPRPPAVVPDPDAELTVLDPAWLYSTRELRFYRPEPFGPLPLPARLVGASGEARDWHALPLP
jgi:hypothetical protein